MDKRWPTLYGQSSNGKIKLWKIWAQKEKDNTATIITEYGYEDGEVQSTKVRVLKGKNVGRANETSSYEQACSEAEAKWKKKRDKKYFTNKRDFDTSYKPLPMLAHDFKKRGKDIEYPALIQPKLNGIRCLATKVSNSEIEYTSRGGKEFTTLEHLTLPLLKVMWVGEIFDGELFTRDLTFQQITSAVKRQQEWTESLEYWIYDTIQEEPFSDRSKRLHECGMESPLVLVPTLPVKSEDQVLKLHQQLVAAGYEGTIIRNLHGAYRVNHRSPDLQKYKDFVDAEFVIVGGNQGVGKDEGAVTFVCETEEGKRFDCRPRGSYQQRQEWWQKLPTLIGKKLTVRYQELTDEGVPRFPVGLNLRDYE